MPDKLPSDEQIIAMKPVKFSGHEDCYWAYSNLAQVVATSFDIQIVFGEMVESSDEVVNVKANARIIMSPEQAALLARALSARVDFYQEVHGPLRQFAMDAFSVKNRSLPVELGNRET